MKIIVTEDQLKRLIIEQSLSGSYWCDDDNPPANIKDRLDTGKRPTKEQEDLINQSKQLLGKDSYGIPIYSVSGELIRQDIYPDFTQGGNDYAYPNFVPEKEIWVDKDIVGNARKTTIAHESKERHEMSKGKMYVAGEGQKEHGAHIEALDHEHKIRLGQSQLKL